MNQRNIDIRMPNDERSSRLECCRNGGVIFGRLVIRHSFELRHLDSSLPRVCYSCDSRALVRNQAPLFDFSSNAALIAARTPSGLLSFRSTGRLLMNRVGVTFTPRKSPSAWSESMRSFALSLSISFLNCSILRPSVPAYDSNNSRAFGALLQPDCSR